MDSFRSTSNAQASKRPSPPMPRSCLRQCALSEKEKCFQEHGTHLFFPFPLGLVAEPFEVTLPALDVCVVVALLPFFTESSCLFYTLRVSSAVQLATTKEKDLP